MKQISLLLVVMVILSACSTSTYVKLPEGAVLKIERGQELPHEEGKIDRTPLSWSSAGGIPYRIEKDGAVIRKGKMRAKFRPASIFWPPFAILYWPIGFRLACNDLTGDVAAECSSSTSQALKTDSTKRDGGSGEGDTESKTTGNSADMAAGADKSMHKLEVSKVADAMECKEAISLKEVTSESESWHLDCGDGESLEVKCLDGTCYIKP